MGRRRRTLLVGLMVLLLTPPLTLADSSEWQHTLAPPYSNVTCEDARMRCIFREGCRMALSNYMKYCSSVMDGHSQYCSENCQHSLVALTSTEQGQQLMNCECSDSSCEDKKRRIEICRPAVLRDSHEDSVVGCRLAEWICMADSQCSKAFEYYDLYCRAMFQGKKCSHRCINSISILRRQENAAKLGTCICDDSNDYECERVRKNMDRLCFHKTTTTASENETNDVDDSAETSNDVNNSKGSTAAASASAEATWWTLLLLLSCRFLQRNRPQL